MGRGDLSDAQREELRPFLPVRNRRCGRWRDHRQMIEGNLHRVRTGVQKIGTERVAPPRSGSGMGFPREPADTLRLASQAWTLAQIETLLRRRFHKACRSRRSRRDCTGTASATKSPPAARRGSRNARKASEMTAPTRSGALTPAYGALGSPPRRLPFPGIERSLSGLHRPRRPSGLTAGLPFIEYPAWMGSAEVRQVRVPVHSCQ
jgi:hypothetical protein